MQATLTGLSEYTAYSVTVSASTSKGVGPASEPIIVITDQDSKFSETLFIAIVKSACTEEVVMLGHWWNYGHLLYLDQTLNAVEFNPEMNETISR